MQMSFGLWVQGDANMPLCPPRGHPVFCHGHHTTSLKTRLHHAVQQAELKNLNELFGQHSITKCFLNFCYILLLNGNGTPLQYSCLENPMDGGAWRAAVHGVAEGRTRLRDFTFTFHFHALEKEMAPHSSVLAWRIPGTAEPGGLPFMGSHRVGHN